MKASGFAEGLLFALYQALGGGWSPDSIAELK